jgi:hypothetical protein
VKLRYSWPVDFQAAVAEITSLAGSSDPMDHEPVLAYGCPTITRLPSRVIEKLAEARSPGIGLDVTANVPVSIM